MAERRQLQVKFPEKALGGVYANQMMVSHTSEEFVIDFLNVFPPEGIVNARIITSPGHLKRMIRALSDNLARYESRHGEVPDTPAPDSSTPEMMN